MVAQGFFGKKQRFLSDSSEQITRSNSEQVTDEYADSLHTAELSDLLSSKQTDMESCLELLDSAEMLLEAVSKEDPEYNELQVNIKNLQQTVKTLMDECQILRKAIEKKTPLSLKHQAISYIINNLEEFYDKLDTLDEHSRNAIKSPIYKEFKHNLATLSKEGIQKIFEKITAKVNSANKKELKDGLVNNNKGANFKEISPYSEDYQTDTEVIFKGQQDYRILNEFNLSLESMRAENNSSPQNDEHIIKKIKGLLKNSQLDPHFLAIALADSQKSQAEDKGTDKAIDQNKAAGANELINNLKL